MPRSKTGFSSIEVARIADLSLRQVQYWTRTGLVRASVYDEPGPGNHARYDLLDILVFMVLAALRDGGVSLQALRVVQRYIRSQSGRELRDVHSRIVWAPRSRLRRDIALVHSETEITSLLNSPGQQVTRMAIPVGALHAQARERIKGVRAERKAKAIERREQRAEAKREANTPLQSLERVA